MIFICIECKRIQNDRSQGQDIKIEYKNQIFIEQQTMLYLQFFVLFKEMFNPPLKRTKSLKQDQYEYEEANKLGQGSFAKVYRGVIKKNNRVVAIRFLPLTLIKQYGQKIKQIITGEVSVLKELSSSDSVDVIFTTRIYDCFMTQNDVVMILEFCPEGNLEDILKKGPLQEKQALQIIYQLARGLSFIAREKVVHRDIKPDNIFIKKEGNHKIFKLGDFGFAVKKQLNSQIVGTPIFMSPELFREDNYGSEVDVWAFGLMVHYILFKQYYFIANSEMQIKKRVLGERYELKKHHLSKISKQMADFLSLCLKFDKKQRISATKISQHQVFNPVKQRIQNLIKQVINTSNVYESNLMKNTIKGRVSNEIIKYSFLYDLSTAFARINPCNYATLYILKHALGQLTVIKSKMQNKVNFLGHPDWNSFCSSQNYEKSFKMLKMIIQKCQMSFETSFNNVIPLVRNQYGEQAANGIQQNLGKGPFDQIKPEIISYELQNNWYVWIQQNKNPETHLLGLQLLLALHIYQNKPIDFDFTTYQIQRGSLDLKSRTQFIQSALARSK